MSDWQTSNDIRRIADKVDPAGARARGCFSFFLMIPIAMIVWSEFQSHQKKAEWSKKSKAEQELVLKEEADLSYKIHKNSLNENCLNDEKRREIRQVCSFNKEHFLKNYCPPKPSKYVFDPEMCRKLKSASW